tara:strand:- start:28 stop:477 length:450 start_codon:yes stop_codon:yes gene_type:complete
MAKKLLTAAAIATTAKNTSAYLGQEATLSQLPIKPTGPVGIMDQFAYDEAIRRQMEKNTSSLNRTRRTLRPSGIKKLVKKNNAHSISNNQTLKRPKLVSLKNRNYRKKSKSPHKINPRRQKIYNHTKKNTNHRQRGQRSQRRKGGKGKQ